MSLFRQNLNYKILTQLVWQDRKKHLNLHRCKAEKSRRLRIDRDEDSHTILLNRKFHKLIKNKNNGLRNQ